MTAFHNRMMNIPCDATDVDYAYDNRHAAYTAGWRHTRHAAAEIANEADALIAEMLEALKHCRDWLDAAGIAETMPVVLQLKAALSKIN